MFNSDSLAGRLVSCWRVIYRLSKRKLPPGSTSEEQHPQEESMSSSADTLQQPREIIIPGLGKAMGVTGRILFIASKAR
jgi:hypothetical protein